MMPSTRRRIASVSSGSARTGDGQIPVIGRLFPAPIAAKVPEIIFLFWVVKILTTAGGEVTSDYLKMYGNFGGGGTEVALFVIALVLQFATRRYRAFAYWSLAYAIAIAGTGLSDFLHSTPTFRTRGRLCCGRSSSQPSSGSGSAARERCPSTASRRNGAKPSTGLSCSQPLPSAPRSETLRRPRSAWATWPRESSSPY